MDIGIQFYPTPKDVIIKMLEPYTTDHRKFGKSYSLLDNKVILDPSAGKADILEFIADKNQYRNHSFVKDNLYAVEIDPILQDTIKARGFKVIHDDFLSFEDDLMFDLIVMNPPFKDGAKHLLKAWDISYDGDIVCLLNAETIQNPHSTERQQVIELIEQHGEWENIGPAFEKSENPTSVEIALVRLKKPSDNKFDFDFDLKGSEKSPGGLDEETIKENGIAVRDIVGNLVIQYGQIKEAYVEFLSAFDKVTYYAEGLVNNGYTNIEETIKDTSGSKKEAYNRFIKEIKLKAWNKILRESGVEKYMTSRVQKEFDKYIQETGNSPLTKENIYKVIQMIIGNSDKILEQAIVDAFDQMTRYADNRTEGSWKHNDSWKVNKKIILPYYVKPSWNTPNDRKAYGFTFSLNWSRDDIRLSDIDKALCYITGKRYSYEEGGSTYSDIRRTDDVLEQSFKLIGQIYSVQGEKLIAESTFFKLKYHLSGTLHIVFKDTKLLDELNYRAALYKKWIPKPEYDEWKAKRNGEERVPKSRRVEKESQMEMF